MSSRPPWHAEYTLEPSQVRQLISANTDLEVMEVSFLGAGWDFFNWLVNEHWVFRFPKRHSDIDTLIHEHRLLQRLDIPIAHPRFDYFVESPTDFNKPFAGYVILPGSSLLDLPSENCNVLAIGRTMGEVLTRLHQLNLTQPLVPVDPISLYRDDFDDLTETASEDLGPVVVAEVKEALASYRLRTRPTHQVTTHNDLSVEHILVNDDTNVIGIIDWADANTANGFVDFAGIWVWGGDPVLRASINHYYIEPKHEDLAQIRVHGLCYALGLFGYACEINNSRIRTASSNWIRERVTHGELADVYAAL